MLRNISEECGHHMIRNAGLDLAPHDAVQSDPAWRHLVQALRTQI
jgi:hypothetical protein